MNEERIKGSSGLNIFMRSLRPAEGTRGVVVIVPGFNSHSGYYEWVAGQLAATGLAVYAVDLRGRGQSDGERFYVAADNGDRTVVYKVAAVGMGAALGLGLHF